jgi:putative ABC transport system permease protein
MTTLLHIAARSALNRRGTLGLVVLCIALATALLLSLERLRTDIRTSFAQALSGADLVVGPRSGAVALVLQTVFHIGGSSGAAQGMKVDSLAAIQAHRAVAWVVPISLGDSHRGRPVVGTVSTYFERYAYGNRQPLAFAQGRAFAGNLDGLFEAVVGAEVAQALGYRLGQGITLAHGLQSGGDHNDHDSHHDQRDQHDKAPPALQAQHRDKPFTVVGILARTGTPVDRAVHVSLQAIEALHLDWAGGAPLPGAAIAPDMARKFDLQPKQVSAALVGLKGRAAVFNVQRFVADFAGEPLQAVLPGVALDALWAAVGVGEQALLAISGLVALVSLVSLVAVVLAGLNERRRELAVLRAVGAGPRQVLGLLAAEGLGVTLCGALLGVVVAALAVVLAAPFIQQHLGIALRGGAPTAAQWALLGAVVLAGMLASMVPGWRAYRLSLADGLSPRT